MKNDKGFEEDIFGDNTIDPEGIVEDIDVAEIEEKATQTAFALCKNLREIYFDEEYMGMHPNLKERLDAEIESLRVLVKMRKSDEKVHDLCLRSIGLNANNASLYAALSRIQSSLLSIQKQMDETVKNINEILKNTISDMEAYAKNEEDDGVETMQNTYRGSKSFIQQMKQQII